MSVELKQGESIRSRKSEKVMEFEELKRVCRMLSQEPCLEALAAMSRLYLSGRASGLVTRRYRFQATD